MFLKLEQNEFKFTIIIHQESRIYYTNDASKRWPNNYFHFHFYILKIYLIIHGLRLNNDPINLLLK